MDSMSAFRNSMKVGITFYFWETHVQDRYLSSFRNTSCVLLELGVQSGGSQLMWLDYLGFRSRVYGVDIEPKVAEISNRRITNFIGDIGDPAFLTFLCESIQRIDIIVDDASHLNWHQKLAFEALYPCLNPNGGIYIVEDIGTSYKRAYGGGWRSEDSFIEFAKAKVDELEAFWSCSGSVVSSRRGRCGSGTLQVPKISALTRSTSAIHFHDGLVVFEKRYKEPAVSMETGSLRLPKRFVGFSLYPSHLADSWLPHMFGMASRGALDGTCSIPQPFQSLDIYDVSIRGLVMETLMDHLKSLSLRQEGGELKRKCSELMSVFQDGLYFSQLGMDFTVVHLKRRSFAVEWNASNRTPLASFEVDRDVKELISWYFGRGAEPLVIADSLYRNRPRPTALQAAPIRAALELQRDGFLRLSALGLDMDLLHLEVAQAFQASQEAQPARMLRRSMRWGALDRLFSSDAILELASFYLGADVKVSGYYLLRLKPGLTPAEYSSSTWHHDNCGSRLKLFILLQDVGEDGFYTEIARGSNSMAYYWYGLDHMSRFDDASVKSFFSVERLFSPAGGGFLFDTNALHRVRVDGQRQRDAVVVEIANVHKLREIPMTSCGSQGLDVGRGFRFPHRDHRRPGF